MPVQMVRRNVKKTISRSFLIAACVVPAIRVWLIVFVAEPTLVSPSLPDAYSQIGATALGNSIWFTLVGIALIAGLAWLGLPRGEWGESLSGRLSGRTPPGPLSSGPYCFLCLRT